MKHPGEKDRGRGRSTERERMKQREIERGIHHTYRGTRWNMAMCSGSTSK
jgi:hypothetical protein